MTSLYSAAAAIRRPSGLKRGSGPLKAKLSLKSCMHGLSLWGECKVNSSSSTTACWAHAVKWTTRSLAIKALTMCRIQGLGTGPDRLVEQLTSKHEGTRVPML